MDTITQEISDVVCTAVTLGHIAKYQERNKRNIQIVCETENDEKAHNSLKKKLAHYGCAIDVCKIEPKDRKGLLITAKDKTYTMNSLENYTNAINTILKAYNQKINEAKGSAILYGAYIGGKYNVVDGILQLLSPSQLIIKPKQYKLENISTDKLKEIYEKNKITINNIINTLQNVNTKNIKLKLDEIKIVDNGANITDKDIFGSVHGLINAIIHYNIYNSVDKYSIACEFACSDDTTKVGSCVPCSIFASSNETPANFTHFGRGDYWNLPQKSEGYDALFNKRNEWEKYVKECFSIGIEKINNKSEDKPSMKIIISKLYEYNISNIPEIFLHSLMYEGKFIEKITRVI